MAMSYCNVLYEMHDHHFVRKAIEEIDKVLANDIDRDGHVEEGDSKEEHFAILVRGRASKPDRLEIIRAYKEVGWPRVVVISSLKYTDTLVKLFLE